MWKRKCGVKRKDVEKGRIKKDVKIEDRVGGRGFVVKVGTDVITRKSTLGNNEIDWNTMQNIAQVLDDERIRCVLVTSGAIACGRMQTTSINELNDIGDEIMRKRILAAIGNPTLFKSWQMFFKQKVVLQGLITQDYLSTKKALELESILRTIFMRGNSIIPIINENDLLSDVELKEVRGGAFGDNDKTAALITRMMLNIFDDVYSIYLTNAPGVLDENGRLFGLLEMCDLSDEKIRKICNGKSEGGSGGMENKLRTIKELLHDHPNLIVYIIDGKRVQQLRELIGAITKGRAKKIGGRIGTCLVWRLK
jgi:glutamate 5-kinase